jgi:hypothetical protein
MLEGTGMLAGDGGTPAFTGTLFLTWGVSPASLRDARLSACGRRPRVPFNARFARARQHQDASERVVIVVSRSGSGNSSAHTACGLAPPAAVRCHAILSVDGVMASPFIRSFIHSPQNPRGSASARGRGVSVYLTPSHASHAIFISSIDSILQS